MKRKLALASVVFASIHGLLLADEGKLTIHPEEFVIRHSFVATALPSSPLLVTLDAKSWSRFEIIRLAAHGAVVKKGDVLIAFDGETLLQSLADRTSAIERRELELAAARRELADLRHSAAPRLAQARRAATDAADDHRYQSETRHALEIEAARQTIRNAESRLRNAKEELVQLERMYSEDDLVEETEEIIMARAREAVEAAEFFLRYETLEQTRRMETTLPRELESLGDAKLATARKLAEDEEEIPRAIALKAHDLATLEVVQTREKEAVEKLEADRALLEILAPVDGVFYHGVVENGVWSAPAELVRTLVVSGSPPVNRPIASLIPTDAKLDLHAMLPEAVARSFGGEKPKGLAMPTGRGDVSVPISLENLATVPSLDQRHHVVFAADWPDGTMPAPGGTADVHVIAYARHDAIVAPAKALAFGRDGWTVEVKLADGKTEHRPVIRGRTDGDRVEILRGLEPGQVIVLP